MDNFVAKRPFLNGVLPPAQVGRPLVLGRTPAPSPDPDEAIKDLFANGEVEADAAAWQALTDGIVPVGIAYGTGNIPAEQDLIDACTPENLTISSVAGGIMDSLEHFNGVLAGMNLLRVSDDPFGN